MNREDIVFVCSDCGHNLFLTKDKYENNLLGKLKEIMYKDCPNCGTEEANWILSRMGNYKEEYGDNDFYPASWDR